MASELLLLFLRQTDAFVIGDVHEFLLERADERPGVRVCVCALLAGHIHRVGQYGFALALDSYRPVMPALCANYQPVGRYCVALAKCILAWIKYNVIYARTIDIDESHRWTRSSIGSLLAVCKPCVCCKSIWWWWCCAIRDIYTIVAWF